MKVDERRVSELAYQIWESEGRPEGQHDRHWRMAHSLAQAEAANHNGEAEEPVQPRFEGAQEPEKPALLQEPPRRKGRLPKADPEIPAQAEGETVAPTPRRAARKPKAADEPVPSEPVKPKRTKSAPPPTPTARLRKPKESKPV